MNDGIRIIPVRGIGDVQPGDDLASVLSVHLRATISCWRMGMCWSLPRRLFLKRKVAW